MIDPGSAEWLGLISPSKAAAILGVSRWESPYSLWHRMAGLVDPEPPRDRFAVGHAMEHALAALWRTEHPDWQLSHGEVQIRHGRFEFPVVCTLDRRARRGHWRRVVEMKTAEDLYAWGDPRLDGEAPADYVCQVTTQMHFSGYTEHAAHLMVMGPRFRHRTYVIEYDPELGNYIEHRCAEFWKSLQNNVVPDLDDTVSTYECVRELHPDIEDIDVQLDPVLAADWLAADRAHKASEAAVRGLKSRVLDAMGTARTASCGGLTIGSRRPHAKGSIALFANHKANLDELRSLSA